MTPEATIEITRNNNELTSVSITMPTWTKVDDCVMSVNIPLLGIKTVAKDENDAEIAINEAIKSFCIASERFGKGLEAELQSLGWQKEISDDHILMDFGIDENNSVFEQIMLTGDIFAQHDLAIA